MCPEVEVLFARKDIVCTWSVIAIALLMVLPTAAQSVMDTQVQNDVQENVGPMATTIYATHPRLLLRDTAWAGGLSVADIQSRCQAATSWWNECQRVLNAGTGVAREIPTFAMKWLLLGNNADADHAISLILAADVNSNDLELLSDVSLGYDWLYNYAGFTAPQKAQAVTVIDTFALNMKAYIFDRHIWSRYMGYTDSVGLAGLAIYGDSPNAQGFIDFDLGNLTILFQALQYSNGSWAEGFRYLNIERLPQLLEFLEAYRTATVPTVDLFADIQKNQGDWLRKMMYFEIYNHMPYGEVARVGDIAQGTLKDNYRRNLDIMTTRLNDSAGAGYMQLLENTAAAQPTYYVGYAFEHILWYDPNVKTDGLNNLPRAMWFGPGSLDYVVFRDGWNTDSTVVTFRSGDGFTGHEHLDNGAFTITNAHPLAIDSGMYAAWGTDHRENYYTRTIAHNAITVFDPAEKFQSPYLGGNLANDGGQRVWWYYLGSSQQNDKTLASYLASKNAGTHFETGNITAFETGGDFDYVFGDYSNSYNNHVFSGVNFGKVLTVTRELTYFGPDWLVVVDHVYTLDPKRVTTYNLHMINQPTINGSFAGTDPWGGTHYDGDTVTVDNGGDKLFSRTMFPDNHLLTKRGGSGYEYVVNGVNCNGGASADPLAGDWRVEVQDQAQTTDHLFLHVMKIQAAGAGGSVMPHTSRITEDNVVGAYFDGKITLYSEFISPYSHASVNISETGRTKFYAFNAVPNTDFSIVRINKTTGTFEVTKAHSSKNGTMNFIVNLTGGDQILIGAEAKGDPSLSDITTNPVTPNVGDNINFSVVLHDPTILGFDTNVTGGRVKFYDGDPAASGKLLGNATIQVKPKSTQTVHFNTTLPWTLTARMIYAVLDLSDVKGFTDTDLTNNKAFVPVYVNEKPMPVLNSVDWAYVNTSVSFSANGSFDHEGPIQSYHWEFGDGLADDGKVVNHIYHKIGNLTVTLKVYDLANVMNKTSKNISIRLRPKKAPVPDFIFGPKDGSILSDFTFISMTKDPDNITEVFLWDFGDGKSGDGTTTKHKFEHYGDYNVTLTVYWNVTANASAVKVVTVKDLPPVPKIGLTTNDTVKRFVINFDALETTDPDDDYNALEFHWDFGDGASAGNDTALHMYTRSGLFNVTLSVVDPVGTKATAKAQVTVTNRLPKASIKATNTTLVWNETIRLDGAGSRDPDGDIMTFTWDFGDNSTPVHNKTATHVYAKADYYTITLTVTDSEDGVGRDTVTVHQLAKVIPPPPKKPPKKQDNTMLYVGIAAGVGALIIVVLAVLMLGRKKEKGPAPERTGLETDLSPGTKEQTEEEVLELEEPAEDIPKAKARPVRPKRPKDDGEAP
jgi:PKD repeat protein